MLLIWQLTEPHAVGVEIVSHIASPDDRRCALYRAHHQLVQDLDDEKELIAAKQASWRSTSPTRRCRFSRTLIATP